MGWMLMKHPHYYVSIMPAVLFVAWWELYVKFLLGMHKHPVI
jgi:hypothetical protein